MSFLGVCEFKLVMLFEGVVMLGIELLSFGDKSTLEELLWTAF